MLDYMLKIWPLTILLLVNSSVVRAEEDITHDPVHSEPVIKDTLRPSFIELREGSAPVPIKSIAAESSVAIIQLEPGQILKVNVSEEDYVTHLNRELEGKDFELVLQKNSERVLSLRLPATTALWMEAYRVDVFLKSKRPTPMIFHEPTLASFRACRSQKSGCVVSVTEDDVLRLVDTRLVNEPNHPGEPWVLLYKINFQKAQKSGEGWVRAIDFAHDTTHPRNDLPTAALVDALLGQWSAAEAIAPSAHSSSLRPRFRLLLDAALSRQTLASGDGSSDSSGGQIGLTLSAPLLEDFSTNLFAQYGQVLRTDSYSLFGLGQEILYGKTGAPFKFGLGGNLLILNNAPLANFRTLAGGRLALLYETPGFFAAYRGGLVANSSSGLGFSNFEILATVGWHLQPDPMGWSVLANYSRTELKIADAGTHASLSIWTIGLMTGL